MVAEFFFKGRIDLIYLRDTARVCKSDDYVFTAPRSFQHAPLKIYYVTHARCGGKVVCSGKDNEYIFRIGIQHGMGHELRSFFDRRPLTFT